MFLLEKHQELPGIGLDLKKHTLTLKATTDVVALPPDLNSPIGVNLAGEESVVDGLQPSVGVNL